MIYLVFYFVSFSLIVLGVGFLFAHIFRFKVPEGHALVSKKATQGRFTDGWHFNLSLPSADNLIKLEKKTLSFPYDKFIELETPDDGCVGVKVSITYSPDDSTGNALVTYKNTQDLDKAIIARVQSALNNWIKGKPLPGTARRALTMKDEAENFVRAKITSVSTTEALAIHNDPLLYYQGGYAVNDLGVRVYEVHVTEMQSLGSGTGKPDWGDDDLAFDADKRRQRIRQKVSSISDFRKDREALIKEFPDEVEYIEKLIEDDTLHSMEHRDQ